VGQQTQSEWDKHEEHIAQLKAELGRAYQVIDQLRQENIQLRNQIIGFQNDNGQTAIHPGNKSLFSPSKNQGYENCRRLSKISFTRLSTLQFAAIVAAVAAGLGMVGVGVITLLSSYLQRESVKPSSLESFTSPSASTVLPAWAVAQSLPIPSRQLGREDSEVVYNLKMPPEFRQSQELQTIVNDVVHLATAKGLPTKPLSITLIDAKTGETAGYQQDTLRYPASVVKMFWMVALYAQLEAGIWRNELDFHPYITKMIKDSDNDASSFIVDQITNTQSLPELKGKDLKKWLYKRQKLNRFFQQAGYKDIDISQKTFPILYLKLSEPKGSDLQLRLNPNHLVQPIRNKITTSQAARLLYETCYLGRAISAKASQEMCRWLNRDLNPKIWKKEPPNLNEFNPIKAFLGEFLADTDVQFYSKAGWTSGSRQEAALVATADGKSIYILAIFADDLAYAKDEKIFPKISRLVYNRMTGYHFKY